MDKKDCLIIKKIIKKQNKIEYDYEANGKWKELLNMDEKMYIEYDMNIEKVPDSIATVPFLCNVLPISFVFNLGIFVDEIDKSFYTKSLDLSEEDFDLEETEVQKTPVILTILKLILSIAIIVAVGFGVYYFVMHY